MRTSRFTKKRLALYALLTLVALFLLLEIGLRLFGPEHLSLTTEEKYWRLQLHTNLFGQWDDTTAIDTESDLIPKAKTPGRKRVLCLGSSSTYGAGLADRREAFPGQLDRLLPDVEVFNTSYGGYNSYQLTIYLSEVLTMLNPDAVIFYYGGNEGYGESAKRFYPRAKEIVKQMRARGKTDQHDLEHAVRCGTADPAALGLYRLLSLSHTFLWWRDATLHARYLADLARVAQSQVGPGMKTLPSTSAQTLDEMCRVAEANDFVLILVPEVCSASDYASKPYWHLMQEQCAYPAAICADPLRILDAHDHQGLFIDSSHLTVTGHRRFAEWLAPIVRQVLEPE